MISELYIAIFFFSIEMHMAFKEDTLPELLYRVSGSKEIEIGKKSSGKPYFIKPDNWFFNISHSRNIGVCAIGQVDLGIDIEIMKEKRSIMPISKMWFTKEESSFLAGHSSHRMENFYHIWSRKESQIKLMGKSVWNMKKIPSLIKDRANLKSWQVNTEENVFSLSLSSAADKNRHMKIDIITDYCNIPVELKPITFS